MARGRRDPQRNRWLLPAALTLTAAVATAGVYFWKEMEDHEAATGFRSEDEETADERRRKSRGMAGRSFGDSAVAAGAGITTKVSEIWKGFFESSDESDSGRDKNRPGPSMSGAAKAAAAAAGGAAAGAAYSERERISTRSMPAEVPMLGNSQEIDWEKKRIIALVISSYEELDESLLLSLPTPVDISRWILLIFVYSRAGYSSASEVERPTSSSALSKRFGMVGGRRSQQDSSDDDLDVESGETSVDVTLPGLILKTFGRDFPHQQVMHYSTPTGVVHMLRHLGVHVVFLSESCASVPNPAGDSSADESGTPQHVPGSMPMSPPPGGVNPSGGGEIVGMLKDWVGEIILVLDEDEDDSAPIRPSAVSGGEDDYDRSRRKKGKMKSGSGAVSESTGRKRRWLKDRTMSKGITICDRQGLKGIWRAKIEGGR